MKRPVDFLSITLLIVIGLLCAGFFFTWYFGFSQRQTAEILLESRKFGSGGAFMKAQWHGSELFDDFMFLTNDFSQLHYQDTRMFARFFNETNTTPLGQQAHRLFNRNDLDGKVLGALLLSKSPEQSWPQDLFPFLSQIVTRSYPGLVTDYYGAPDYFSEVGMLALGNMGGERSLNVLVDVLRESPAAYERHQMACQALANMGSSQAIPILQERMLDKDFRAILPAYEALVALGDSQAKEIVEKRLALGLESGDDMFIRKAIQE